MTMNEQQKIWIPAPTNEANNLLNFGGLNTSPCTNFHPVSSKVSSYKMTKNVI